VPRIESGAAREQQISIRLNRRSPKALFCSRPALPFVYAARTETALPAERMKRVPSGYTARLLAVS
jgi:hypothetical protein